MLFAKRSQKVQEHPSQVVEYVLTALFTLEMAIKLVAWHWDYFRSGWNLLDFVRARRSVHIDSQVAGPWAQINRGFSVNVFCLFCVGLKWFKMIGSPCIFSI